jgi:AAA+ ATPase superfamily predicted ATPase
MFVGRNYELGLIRDRLSDRSKPQLLIIYGRRRIGKSTLIKKSLDGRKNVLFFEGIQGESTQTQIDQFLSDLARQTGRIKLAARNWREVFQGLEETIAKGRWIVVFDEFSWMAAGRSSLVSDLKLYWDRWAKNKEFVLFLCGSVSSFMVKHLVHSKALHNRKTLEMCLGPLTPAESSQFIKRRGLWEKAQLYMCLGGVPKYLEQIDPALSLEKNLNRLCFCSNGFFVNEFETLFKEQFRSVKTYENIVQILADSPASLSDLSRKTKIAKGGGLHEHLRNLISAQFVREYSPFTTMHRRRTRTKLYKLTDPFLIFYMRYIHKNKDMISMNTRENLFRSITQPSIEQYYGFAFERLCEDALDNILKGIHLDLADIVNIGPYFQRGYKNGGGLQIDELIMRRDNVWTVIEYKYTKKPIGKQIIDEVSKKIERLLLPRQISVEKVLISACGATKSVVQSGYFDHILTISDII